MRRHVEPVQYVGSQISSPPSGYALSGTPDPMYSSVQALLAAVDANGGGAIWQEFPRGQEDSAARCTLYAQAGATTPGTDAFGHKAFLVSRVLLKSTEGAAVEAVLVEEIFTATWTTGEQAVAPSLGGRADHTWCGDVSVTRAGEAAADEENPAHPSLMLARTGADIEWNRALPASIEVPDVAERLGILHLFESADSSVLLISLAAARWL